MLEGLECADGGDGNVEYDLQEVRRQWEVLSAFHHDDHDHDHVHHSSNSSHNNNCMGSMTERGAILKNLSVSFGNDTAAHDTNNDTNNDHDDDGNALKPTLGYDSPALVAMEQQDAAVPANANAKEVRMQHTTTPPPPPRPAVPASASAVPSASSTGGKAAAAEGEGIWISNCNTTSSLSTDNDDVVGERTLLCNLVTAQKWEEVLHQCEAHAEEAGMWWCKRDR